MIYEYTDYRKFLRHLLFEKKSKNPRLSMRAMAKKLGLSPATLSQVLNRKKNLSTELALNVANQLGLSSQESDYFCLLVQNTTTKKASLKATIQKKLTVLNPRGPVFDLDIERFTMISEWYHLVLLGLLNLQTQEKTLGGLAASVGIDHITAEMALDRLQRLKLVQQNEDGTYKRVQGDIFVRSKLMNVSLNSYHRQMMQKASESIESQSYEERIIRTANIAIDQEQVVLADQYVEEFFAKMSKLTQEAQVKNSLYHLGTQFFRLNKKSNKLGDKK